MRYFKNDRYLSINLYTVIMCFFIWTYFLTRQKIIDTIKFRRSQLKESDLQNSYFTEAVKVFENKMYGRRVNINVCLLVFRLFKLLFRPFSQKNSLSIICQKCHIRHFCLEIIYINISDVPHPPKKVLQKFLHRNSYVTI
jgi:hypothetical protein